MAKQKYQEYGTLRLVAQLYFVVGVLVMTIGVFATMVYISIFAFFVPILIGIFCLGIRQAIFGYLELIKNSREQFRTNYLLQEWMKRQIRDTNR